MNEPGMQLLAFGTAKWRELSLGRDLALLTAYGFVFALLNLSAVPWAGAGFFSLWYPAAGLRFFVLWHRGPACTPWLMAAELCADWISGSVPFTGPEALGSAFGALRPGLAYGIALAGVRSLARPGSGPLTLPPMPMGIAALAAPTLNAVLVEPFRLIFPAQASPTMGIDAVIGLTGLAVGDLLGILVLAPPLLWIAGAVDQRALPRTKHIALRFVVQDCLVLAACLLLTVALWRSGLGIQPIPSLLAGAWIGLRHGRAAAWLAILAQVAVFLPWSATAADDHTRLTLHLGLAAVVLVAWLAGSFADAHEAAQALLERRNRLLFQAERLKTLRAMSVAIIHEISQPLSTLAIEASHLKDLTANLGSELETSAAIVDRKARTLSEMVRSLRRFGGRDVDAPTLVPVTVLVQAARQISLHEFREHGCTLDVALISPDLVVRGQEVELTQALVNLLRNAAGACLPLDRGERSVTLRTRADDHDVEIEVGNQVAAMSDKVGMGVGLIIARTIVEAHGGTITRNDDAARVHFTISLPRAGKQP